MACEQWFHMACVGMSLSTKGLNRENVVNLCNPYLENRGMNGRGTWKKREKYVLKETEEYEEKSTQASLNKEEEVAEKSTHSDQPAVTRRQEPNRRKW